MLKKGKALTFQSCYDKLGIRRLTKRAKDSAEIQDFGDFAITLFFS